MSKSKTKTAAKVKPKSNASAKAVPKTVAKKPNKLAEKPTGKSGVKPVAKPVAKTAAKPAAKPVVKPVAKPAAKSVAKSAAKSVVGAKGKVAPPVKNKVSKSSPKVAPLVKVATKSVVKATPPKKSAVKTATKTPLAKPEVVAKVAKALVKTPAPKVAPSPKAQAVAKSQVMPKVVNPPKVAQSEPAVSKVVSGKGSVVSKASTPSKIMASIHMPPPVMPTPKHNAKTPVRLPEKTGGNANPSRYGKEELAHFRSILEEKRASLLQDIQDVKDAGLLRPGGDNAGASAAVTNHLADSATDYSMQETGLDLVERTTKYLTLIEDSLDRVDAGVYGICKDCREVPQNLCPTCPLIPKERLEAVPTATRCVHTKQEAKKRESVEMRMELARMFAEQQRK